MNLPLRRSFYDRPPEIVARELIGKLLLRETALGLCGGRIVEAEAYLAHGDSACHAARGQTPRNTVMFGPAGFAYVYSIHAKWCFNVVTQPPDTASAVLIRAIEPLFGLEGMRSRRPAASDRDLARGPARMCAALEITRDQNGMDLSQTGELWLARDPKFRVHDDELGTSVRIGVTSAFEMPLRFYLRGNRFVSGTNRLNV